MYLGAIKSRGANAPYINIGAKTPFATVRNPRHGHLQGYLQGLGATMTQAGYNAATAAGAPGFYGDPATWNPPTGTVTIWYSDYKGNTYYKAVAPNSVAQLPNGGQVFTYAQASASAGSPQNINVGFVQVPSILISGQATYATVFAPGGTVAPTPPIIPATAVVPAPTPPIIPATAVVPAPVVQGPVQSSLPIAAAPSPLPTPSVPFMDTSGAAGAGAVAAAINGQGVVSTLPADTSGTDTSGGPSLITWGILGVLAFLLLRR